MNLKYWLCTTGLAGLICGSAPDWPPQGQIALPTIAALAAAHQPNLHAQKALVRYYENDHRSEYQLWLRRAALLGDTESAIQLANLLPNESRYWLSHAADLGAIPAQIELNFAQREVPPGYTINRDTIESLTPTLRNQLALLTLSWGTQATAQHWRNIAPNSTPWQRRRRVDDWFRDIPSNCDQHLMLYTETPSALPQIYDWLYQLQDVFSETPGRLCVSKAPPNVRLSCVPIDGRAHCVQQEPHEADRTVVYVTKQGRANTRNGVVYINQNASADVFIHELAHAWGFGDEYRMHMSVREPFCDGQFSFTAKNLVVSESSLLTHVEYQNFISTLPWRDALTVDPAARVTIMGIDYWRLGSSAGDGIGLYPAATCEGTGVQAWKPLRNLTFMEQAEIGDIPALYLEWMLEPNL